MTTKIISVLYKSALTLSLPAYHDRQWKSWRIFACLEPKGLNCGLFEPNPAEIYIIYAAEQKFEQSIKQ